jgi:hypothetical protein
MSRTDKISLGVVGHLIFLLPAMSALFSAFNAEVGGLNLSPERFAAVLIAPVILFWLLTSLKKLDLLAAGFFICLGLLALSNFSSDTMKGLFAYYGPMLFLLYLSRWKISVRTYKKIVMVWLILFSLLAALAFLAGVAFAPILFDADNRFRFLFFEANIYGAAAAFFLVLACPFLRKRPIDIFIFALGLMAVMLSFSRGPVVALFVALLLLASKGKPKKIILASAFGVVLAVGLYLAQFLPIVEDNFSRNGTVGMRLLVLKAAWDDFLTAPILGLGPLSFRTTNSSLLQSMGTDDSRNVWIWQFQVAYLHDFGVVGLLCLYVFFFFALMIVVRRKNEPLRWERFCGFAAIFVAAQFTTTHTSALFWIALGLIFTRISGPTNSRFDSGQDSVNTPYKGLTLKREEIATG